MHGREARIPADLIYGEPRTGDQDHDFVARQQENLSEAFALTRQHLAQAARRRKTRYDLRTRPQKFATGSKVWCYVPRRYKGRYQKWRSLYQGPFEIVEQLGPVTYRIRRDNPSRTFVVHVDKLKPCLSDSGSPSRTSEVDANPADDRPSTSVAGPRPKRRATPDLNTPSTRPRRTVRAPARFRQ